MYKDCKKYISLASIIMAILGFLSIPSNLRKSGERTVKQNIKNLEF